MKKIATNKAPQAIGPYSQAIVFNGMLFTSGQIGINPQTGNIVLRATMDNREHTFWTGQSVKVRLMLNMMHV